MMRSKSRKSYWFTAIRTSAIRFAAIALTVSLVSGPGCSMDNGFGSTQPSAAEKPASTTDASDSPQPPASPQESVAAREEPVPAPESTAAKSEWEAQAPLTIDDEASRRALAEDMIYATIRIKMEDMIDQRAALLKSGKDPADVEVRQLEGSIMRARDLLIEAGEIVDEIEPPIVQVRTPAAPQPGVGTNP